MMKRMWVTTGLYVFCAVVWLVNFGLHWHQDGAIAADTALFGVAAVCFGVSAMLNLIRIHRLKKGE